MKRKGESDHTSIHIKLNVRSYTTPAARTVSQQFSLFAPTYTHWIRLHLGSGFDLLFQILSALNEARNMI